VVGSRQADARSWPFGPTPRELCRVEDEALPTAAPLTSSAIVLRVAARLAVAIAMPTLLWGRVVRDDWLAAALRAMPDDRLATAPPAEAED